MSDRSPLPQAPETGEDRFVILCAGKELFQRRLTDIIRQCGIRVPAVLAAFAQEVGAAHDELASASDSDEDADQRTNLTASRLTLMGDDDLELDIRINALITRLREAGGRNLWRCQSRYMTLLSRPAMSETTHPAGPEAICLGLWAICRHAGGGLEPTLALLDRLEQGLCQQISGLYGEMDGLLAGYGIGPAPTGQNPSGTTDPRTSRAPSGDPLSALQQAISQQLDADRSTVPQLAHHAAGSGNPTLDAAALIMLNHLSERLTALESRSLSASPDDARAASPPSCMPLGTLRAKDLDLPLGKHEAVAFDTLALIFEALFDSADLPDAIKEAIGRLQIPLLKLSIIDPSLLANAQHPARSLINRMARAGVGLPQGSNHPVCQRISELAVSARRVLEQDGSLEPQLAELDLLIRQRDQAVREAAGMHVQTVLEHENRQYAMLLADHWLRLSLARTGSPEIASFLEQYWWRVMVAAAAEGGTQGKRWQEDSHTADELIWSVLPKQTAEERKRLAGLASSLLGRISAGLDAIGVAASERKSFLDTLFNLQTRALRNQALLERPPGAQASKPMAETLLRDRNGQQLRYLPDPVGSQAPPRAPAGRSPVGDWLRFMVSPQESSCGLCCWQSPASGRVLLFNPEWSYAVAMPRATLDQQLRSGHARIVSRIAVFDAAAERALELLKRR